MDARALLRQYLAQRRELGESEFVLDTMSVEAAMRALGVPEDKIPPAPASAPTPRPAPKSAQPSAPPRTGAQEPPQPRSTLPKSSVREREPSPAGDDWRAALRAAGAAPSGSGSAASPAATPPMTPATTPPVSPATTPVFPATTPYVLPATTPPAAAAQTTAGEGAAVANPANTIVIGSSTRELFAGPLGAAETLEQLAELIRICTLCPLYATALNPVPGEGDPRARLVCVGEAPGETEDKTGRPFIGRAGELLTKILESVDFKREDVFICNVLKHRPPGNRNPAPDEIAACRPYLMRQLDLLRPGVILALGTFAAQTLLETKLTIGQLRGNVHTFHGIPLVVTYHPAALLRNPNWKRPTWEDVKLVRRLLDRTTGST
jgi:DNA polymerase